MEKIINQNPMIKKAVTIADIYMQSDEARRIRALQEKALRDQGNKLYHARQEGLELGKKEGLEEGATRTKLESA